MLTITFNVFSVLTTKGANSWDRTIHSRGKLLGQITVGAYDYHGQIKAKNNCISQALRQNGYELPEIALERYLGNSNEFQDIGIYKQNGFMSLDMLLWLQVA